MKYFFALFILFLSLIPQTTDADIWCNEGNIVEVADITWNQAQILANFSGTIPANTVDVDRYKAFHAMHTYSTTFASNIGNSSINQNVPDAGQVGGVIYAPYSYTNVPTPGAYNISQGIKFKINKCYGVLPWIHRFESTFSSNPDNNENALDTALTLPQKLRRK